ncbi:MAG: ROK family protein [Armatimonadota bacterium]
MTLLDINTDGNAVAGVYISPEAIDVVLAGPKLDVLARRTLTEGLGKTPQEGIVAIANCIRRCAKTINKDVRKLAGVGISVAGVLDDKSGTIVVMGNRPGWENVPIVRLLSEELKLPVYVEQDVKAAALVREWFGKKDHEGNALYIMVSEGVGAAFTQGSGLFRGDRGFGVYMDQMIIQPDGVMDGLRYSGSLESVVSDVAFIRSIWPEMKKTAAEMTVSERNSLVQKGVRMARKGDDVALGALRSITRNLGIAIGNTIAILDPRVVFVTGTMVDGAPDLIGDMLRKETFSRMASHMMGVEIRILRDSRDFLLRGAAGLALWQPYKVLLEDNVGASSVRVSGSRRP